MVTVRAAARLIRGAITTGDNNAMAPSVAAINPTMPNPFCRNSAAILGIPAGRLSSCVPTYNRSQPAMPPWSGGIRSAERMQLTMSGKSAKNRTRVPTSVSISSIAVVLLARGAVPSIGSQYSRIQMLRNITKLWISCSCSPIGPLSGRWGSPACSAASTPLI